MEYQDIGSGIEVNESHISIVRDLLGKTWQDMGRKLGVPNAKLENMTVDLNASGVSEMTYQVLNMWKQEKGEAATLNVLIRCMAELKRRDIIVELKKTIPANQVSCEYAGPTEDTTKHAGNKIRPKHKLAVNNKVGCGWRDLGEALEFDDGELDTFESKDCKESCKKMLAEWIKRKNPSLSDLVNALKESNFISLADEVENIQG